MGARDLSNNSEGRCTHGNTYEAVPELREVVAPSVSVSPSVRPWAASCTNDATTRTLPLKNRIPTEDKPTDRNLLYTYIRSVSTGGSGPDGQPV